MQRAVSRALQSTRGHGGQDIISPGGPGGSCIMFPGLLAPSNVQFSHLYIDPLSPPTPRVGRGRNNPEVRTHGGGEIETENTAKLEMAVTRHFLHFIPSF